MLDPLPPAARGGGGGVFEKDRRGRICFHQVRISAPGAPIVADCRALPTHRSARMAPDPRGPRGSRRPIIAPPSFPCSHPSNVPPPNHTGQRPRTLTLRSRVLARVSKDLIFLAYCSKKLSCTVSRIDYFKLISRSNGMVQEGMFAELETDSLVIPARRWERKCLLALEGCTADTEWFPERVADFRCCIRRHMTNSVLQNNLLLWNGFSMVREGKHRRARQTI